MNGSNYELESSVGKNPNVVNTALNPFIEFEPTLLNYRAIDLPDGLTQILFVPIEHYRTDEFDSPRVSAAIGSAGIILYESIGQNPAGTKEIQKIANGDYATWEKRKNRQSGPGVAYDNGLCASIFNSGVKTMPLDVIASTPEFRNQQKIYNKSQAVVLGGNSQEEALEAYKNEQTLLFETFLIRERYVLSHFKEIIEAAKAHRTMKKHPNPTTATIVYGDRHLTIFNALRLRTYGTDIETDILLPDGALRYPQQAYSLYAMEREVTNTLWMKNVIEEILLDGGNGPELNSDDRQTARTAIHQELDQLDDDRLLAVLDRLSKGRKDKEEFRKRIAQLYHEAFKTLSTG